MKIHHLDYVLLGISIALITLGILILASVSASLSIEKFATPFYFLKHQILLGLIPGIILAFFAFRIPLSFFKKWSPFLLFINLILLILVFVPKIGFETGGASRWLILGPISFQPSEFLKLTFILYLASWLNSHLGDKTFSYKPRTKPFLSKTGIEKYSYRCYTLIPFLVIISALSALLIFQPDISTLSIIIACSVIMYFLAETPLWHTILVFLIGAGSLFSLIKIAPYRASRLLVFLKPETDPMGVGYQIKQALITVGSGGILGLGLGMSAQIGFLPQSMSDSIFAIFAEETGFVGCLVLVILFLLFAWQGFKVIKTSSNKFSCLIASGICSWFIIQGFVNIGSIIGILPLTGIPLPFISYGGSHIVAELIGVGILLNISENA